MDTARLIELISEVWRPAHFRVGNGLRCGWQFETSQVLPWELFRGRLLDARQTRETRTFLAWNILPVVDGQLGSEPLVSILLDEASHRIEVTRGILTYAWEPAGEGETLEGSEMPRWLRERVGGLSLDDVRNADELTVVLRSLVRQAVVGTSRLPLTSVESPLPAFALGQLAYVPRVLGPSADPNRPLRTWFDLTSHVRLVDMELGEKAKVLEAVLRAVVASEIDAAADAIGEWLAPLGELDVVLPRLARRLFNEVSLSPYTDFVDNTLAVIARLLAERPAAEIGLLGFLLRQLCRHLTAYDLVLFHYRGANYPDALLLDALLRRILELVELEPDHFVGDSDPAMRLRRALRHALLMRRHYEGHAVPDAPTSPGENQRVLPEPFERVPEEQVAEPRRRRRRLFEDSLTVEMISSQVRSIVAASLGDLEFPEERRELGIALFIDRPLGFFKEPAETDQTPILSYEAYSPRIATARLRELEKFADELRLPIVWRGAVADAIDGLGIEQVPDSLRPAVSLADARKVSDDFRLLRTTAGSRTEFWRLFDTSSLPWSDPARELPLVVRIRIGSETRMHAYDAAGKLRLAFDVDATNGFVTRGGVELPRAGLRLFEVFDESGGRASADSSHLPARFSSRRSARRGQEEGDGDRDDNQHSP
jgi:hypothetical protein